MSFKDQQRRRRVAEKRGRRGTRRASAMLLRQVVLHPVADGVSTSLDTNGEVRGFGASFVAVDEYLGLSEAWED